MDEQKINELNAVLYTLSCVNNHNRGSEYARCFFKFEDLTDNLKLNFDTYEFQYLKTYQPIDSEWANLNGKIHEISINWENELEKILEEYLYFNDKREETQFNPKGEVIKYIFKYIKEIVGKDMFVFTLDYAFSKAYVWCFGFQVIFMNNDKIYSLKMSWDD